MNVHRVTVIVLDFERHGSDDIKRIMQNAHYTSDQTIICVESAETADIGEWSDDHPLNKRDTFAAEVARLFGGEK